MTIRHDVPSREVLTRAARVNAELGHENLGFLSEEWGLAPGRLPTLEMPPSHRAWDEVIAQLPDLFRTLRLREVVERLPVLSARPEDLADQHLLRASALMSMLAHAYVRVETQPPVALPPAVGRPWQEISERLHRRAPVLSYIDLIVYNWRLRDPGLPDPMRVENLDLLIPTVGNREERSFHLTQVEILAQCAPIVGAVVRAQEAIAGGDRAALERELLLIIERLRHVAEVSFQKIDPNPRGSGFVDPVVWAKTVAPFAVPITPGVQGPSGTSSPIFHLLDVFLGRAGYESLLGQETLHIRDWYPAHWLAFLAAVDAVSLRDFVTTGGDPHLQGVFQMLMETYAGDKGFLGIHRLKVYGYLETAFKMGRSVTIGGFKGLFRERTWHAVDVELMNTRDERYVGLPAHHLFGTPAREPFLERSGVSGPNEIRQIQLDVGNTGIQYRPGDRAGVLAENSTDLIDRTLRALRASGEEVIRLDRAWQRAVRARSGYEATTSLPLATLLCFGKLRPVGREVAKALAALSASSRLREIVNARDEDQWELWDLLDLLYEGGFDTRRLWKAEPWEPESICRVVPPERHRLYSIASAMRDGSDSPQGRPQTIDFMIRRLEYQTKESATTRAATRRGTASTFLHRVATGDPEGLGRRRVSLEVLPARRFHLPDDRTRPIVMFAGGAGIAPFRGFLQERAQHPESGENWLFIGTRMPDDLFFRDELERWVGDGHLRLRVAFSAADAALRFVASPVGGQFVTEPGRRQRIGALVAEDENARLLWDLLRSERVGGLGAHLYVCGQTGFAVSVMEALRAVIERFSPGADQEARAAAAHETFYQLVADRRYLQDIFTTYSGPYQEGSRSYNASDVVLHNDDEHGCWFVVDGRVYDLTEFIHLHPGGHQTIRNYLGMDATRAYEGVLHHLNSEVDAMLGMYEIGHIRRLRFAQGWSVAIGPRGLFYVALEDAFLSWVRYLYLIVEMENALGSDFGVSRKATTRGEEPATLTPLKVQIVAETHRRFLSAYLDDLIGGDLGHLWAISTGFGAPGEDVRRLDQTLAAHASTPNAALTRSCADVIDDLNERLVAATAPDAALSQCLGTLCSLVERHDRRFLARLKLTVREGVILFETHQDQTGNLAGRQLVEILERVPTIVREYFDEVADGMRAVGVEPASLAAAQPAENAAPTRRRTAAEIRAARAAIPFPGHGTVIAEAEPSIATPGNERETLQG